MSRVAVAQMCSVDDLQENLTAAAKLIHTAAAQQAELVALPENFAFLGRRDDDKCRFA